MGIRLPCDVRTLFWVGIHCINGCKIISRIRSEYPMQKRRFGRTGHMSTVAIFGAAAFWEISQEAADQTMQKVVQAGINHIDVAPSYGQAEERVGPWLGRERDRFFVGCKTMERTRDGAAAELGRSLKKLQTDHFDLYQIHAITSFAELLPEPAARWMPSGPRSRLD
jgi:aryl-alcohol dehydrogenase-like predicted oxidoreductase